MTCEPPALELDSYKHQDARQEGQNRIDLDHGRKDDGLAHGLGLLGDHLDGGRRRLALVDSGDPADDGDGHAGGEDLEALVPVQSHGRTAAEEPQLVEDEEGNQQAVDALRTKKGLKDKAAGELVGILRLIYLYNFGSENYLILKCFTKR